MDFANFISGGIATRAPLRREFTFADQQITGYFLDLPALQVRELFKAEERDAAFLAAIVCDEHGNPLLTLEQARSLKVQQMNALLAEAYSALGLTSDGRAAAKKP